MTRHRRTRRPTTLDDDVHHVHREPRGVHARIEHDAHRATIDDDDRRHSRRRFVSRRSRLARVVVDSSPIARCAFASRASRVARAVASHRVVKRGRSLRVRARAVTPRR